MTETSEASIKPGIYLGVTNEEYHASEGISKSGLWTIDTQSPAHFKYGERTESNAFDFGEACHLAILQPDVFEKIVVRGPDDRRGNKWKDMLEGTALSGQLLLTSGDYDGVSTIRDRVHSNAFINSLITGGKPIVEASGYAIEPETGELVRVRPDLYREDLGIIVDVKSTQSAHPDAFSRSVINYGYHAQEALYSDVWQLLGKPVSGFVFLAWEKKAPYAYSLYELPPSIVDEGRARMRRALETYAECKRSKSWPAYSSGVSELSFKRWAYELTNAPDPADEQMAA